MLRLPLSLFYIITVLQLSVMAQTPPTSNLYPIARYSVRYELAARTRRVERAWLGCKDSERRQKATELMKRAVSAFFANRTAEVASTLDEAARILEKRDSSTAIQLADSLSFTLSTGFTGTDATKIGMHVRTVYDAVAEIESQGLIVEVTDSKGLLKRLPVRLKEEDTGWEMPEGEDADVVLEVLVTAKGEVLRRHTLILSRAERLKQRLEAIERGLTERLLHPTDRATIRARLEVLKGLQEGRRFEIDYRAVQMLEEVEYCLKHSKGPKESIFAKLKGDHLLAVPRNAGPDWWVRVYRPEKSQVTVLALHGAGGSENMFFEGYGDGLLLQLCKKLGWALIAPRVSSPLEDYGYILNQMDPDSTVLLIGHSLGAIASLVTAQRDTERFSGVALISGAGFGDLKKLRHVPVFVAVGSEDFSLTGSGNLAKSLAEIQGNVIYRIYEAEHLLVVPEALPEIVAWFQNILKKEQESAHQQTDRE